MAKQQQKNRMTEQVDANLYEYVKQQFDLAEGGEASPNLSADTADDYLGYSDQDRPDEDIRDFIEQH